MTRTASTGLAMVAGFVLLLVVASVMFLDLDRDGLAGAAVGLGLGLVNLAVGGWVTTRALKRGMRSALKTLMTGFFVRLLVVAALVVAFQRTEAVDAAAFALTFMVLFFVYLGVEVLLVERSLNGGGRPA